MKEARRLAQAHLTFCQQTDAEYEDTRRLCRVAALRLQKIELYYDLLQVHTEACEVQFANSKDPSEQLMRDPAEQLTFVERKRDILTRILQLYEDEGVGAGLLLSCVKLESTTLAALQQIVESIEDEAKYLVEEMQYFLKADDD